MHHITSHLYKITTLAKKAKTNVYRQLASFYKEAQSRESHITSLPNLK
jgi:hypothetical protein